MLPLMQFVTCIKEGNFFLADWGSELKKEKKYAEKQ